MKIVLVENIDPYRPVFGGIGAYLRDLTLFLKEKGVHTSLVGAGGKESTGESGELHIPVDRFIDAAGKSVSHPVFIAKLLTKVRKIKLENDTIIHGQRPDVLTPFAGFKRRSKLVCTLHDIHSRSVYMKRGQLQGMFYERLERLSLRRALQLIAVNEAIAHYFTEKYRFCRDKTVTIPIGVDTDLFRPMDKKSVRESNHFQENDKIVLYAGRLDKEKNLPFLLDAFTRVKKIIPQAKLALVGTGHEENRLQALVEADEIPDVLFLGSVDHRRMPELYNCADVFALCSLYEGSPVSVREALACNVPVVSTDVGDVRSVISNLESCEIAEPEVHRYGRHLVNAINRTGSPDYREYIAAYSNTTAFERTFEIYSRLI
jgi:glycosyltransferase involved in cell wall biosynthesis